MALHFIDLQAQRARLGCQIETAITRVLESGQYVLGPEVQQLEAELAQFCGANHTLSCANGTDALALVLRAWGVGPGDAVFCPSFTFCATGEVVPWVGATPVFVDIEPDTYNICPDYLETKIQAILAEGKVLPKVIIGVCLFGQPANYPRLREIADQYGLKLIADSAQGFGGTRNGMHAIEWADCVTTSFFPAKPLGCYGDGGAVFTHDAHLADLLTSLRVHGQATAKDLEGKSFAHDPKYLNMRVGMNSRLDALQAAILRVKLSIFADEITRRGQIATYYSKHLKPAVTAVPDILDSVVSTWAQYTIEHENRDGLQAHLRRHNIPSAVYYPVPMHMNLAYQKYARGPLPVTEDKAKHVISLPMHPYLETDTQDFIIETVASFKA